MMDVPKICLNMIVKNESAVIIRLLESVMPLIDTYCICDTGSTDNTITLIREYCESKNISGKIIEESFRDFGYNRSYALTSCVDMKNADYILLMDADMKLEIKTTDILQFKRMLINDAYYVVQGCPDFYNANIRIIRNDPSYRYWGVTHEYIELPDNAVIENISKDILFITDLGDGGCKENKFKRDIELLIKGLEINPNNPRYLFYLANSYRDSNEYEKAIEIYIKRIQVGGWLQETWHSYYSIGNCYMKLNRYEPAVFYWLEAYQIMPTRIENLYKIVNYYRRTERYALALLFYEVADKIRLENPPLNHLFLENDVYEHKLDYEIFILGYYTNMNKHAMINMCMSLLNKRNINTAIYNNIMLNYKHYCPMLTKHDLSYDELNERKKSLLDILNNIGNELMKEKTDMYSSTPSIYMKDSTEIYVCKRYVNYTIDAEGKYINQENIITINIFAILKMKEDVWSIIHECVMDYNKEHDDMYIGMEDVKLFVNNNIIEYSANRATIDTLKCVEHGIYDIDNNKIIESNILKYSKRTTAEKNWVMFNSVDNTRKFIYKWNPITICEKNENELHVINEIPTPRLFKQIRGSSNGVYIDDELWFLCHLVNHETRRHYYHMFVVIGKESNELIKYTQLFTFEKEIVEYSLGFVYEKKDDQLLIGYSTNDNATKYLIIGKDIINEMMITHSQ
jgi:tetratricopeptide (TPR) repeat protein